MSANKAATTFPNGKKSVTVFFCLVPIGGGDRWQHVTRPLEVKQSNRPDGAVISTTGDEDAGCYGATKDKVPK